MHIYMIFPLVSCNLVLIMSIKIMKFIFPKNLIKLFLTFTIVFAFELNSKELAKFNDWSAFAEGE